MLLGCDIIFGGRRKEVPNYLRFIAAENNATIMFGGQRGVSEPSACPEVSIDYSTDNCRTWTTVGNAVGTVRLNKGDVAFFKASDGYDMCRTGGVDNVKFLINSGRVYARGDVTSMASSRFADEEFVDEGRAYRYMFARCTALLSAPELPSRRLAARQYENMFFGCSSMVEAPSELPAETLNDRCYACMFQNCSSLKKPPRIMARSRGDVSSGDEFGSEMLAMFMSCSSLTETPEMTFGIIDSKMFYSMFSGCVSLVDASNITAIAAGDQTCYSMFSGCTSLKTPPNISAHAIVGSRCFYGMFKGCASLEEPISLPATEVGEGSYYYMFDGCSSLKYAPSLPFVKADRCSCYGMFRNCTSIERTPELFAEDIMYVGESSTPMSDVYYEMFRGCSRVSEAGRIHARNFTVGSFCAMFAECTNLRSVPPMDILDIDNSNSPSVSAANAFEGMFLGCSSLVDIADLDKLPPTTGSYVFREMFSGCSSISRVPKISMRSVGPQCYYEMFNGCSSMTGTAEIFLTSTPEARTLYGMFRGCSGITSARVRIPKTSAMVAGAMDEAFSGCSSLSDITFIGDSLPVMTKWVDGVSSTGVFRCPPEVGTQETIARGVDSCPEGWAVEDVIDEISPVEYIEGDGVGYFDSGVRFGGEALKDVAIEMSVDVQLSPDVPMATKRICGVGTTVAAGYYIQYLVSSSATSTRYFATAASTISGISPTERHLIKIVKPVGSTSTTCYVDGVETSSKTTTATTAISASATAIVLGWRYTATSTTSSGVRIFSFSVENKTTGVSKTLYPYKSKMFGCVLVDPNTGEVIRPSGGYGLIVGPDKGLPYDYEVEWLQSDGISYVDTGIELYSPTNDLSRVEFDMTAELCIDPSKLSSSTVPRYISLVGIANDRNYGIGCSNQGDSFCATVYGNYNRYSTGYVVSADSTTLHELRLKIEAGICDFYYDGTLVKNASVPSSSYDLVPGIPFLVFARSYPSGGSIARIVNGMNRASRIKITSNGKTFDGIAVSKDGVGYFYDRTLGQLIGNSAKDSNGNPVGALIMGPRKS